MGISSRYILVYQAGKFQGVNFPNAPSAPAASSSSSVYSSKPLNTARVSAPRFGVAPPIRNGVSLMRGAGRVSRIAPMPPTSCSTINSLWMTCGSLWSSCRSITTFPAMIAALGLSESDFAVTHGTITTEAMAQYGNSLPGKSLSSKNCMSSALVSVAKRSASILWKARKFSICVRIVTYSAHCANARNMA